MQHKSQRRPTVVLLFALIGILFAACSGPNLSDTTNAAVVNSQDISMARFLTMTKLIESVSALNDASLPSWQLPRGRTAHQKAQQQALNLLMTNMLVDSHAKKLLTPAAWARIKELEDTQLKALFAQVPAQYKLLVNQGLLTPDTYRPFIHQQIVEQQLIDPKNVNGNGLKVDVAHVKIITVKSKKQADTIYDQIKKGTAWATLATANSVDSAQAAGGDIAVLPAGYLPVEVDAFIFGKNAIALNTVYEMQKPSRLGYSIIEVLSRSSGIAVSALDSTQPIVTNAQISPQGAAVNGLLTQWARAASAQVNVNWCGNVSGVACAPLLTLDQQPGT
ncbi:MAG: peptidylprolyl isomerase [Ktedonobacterales bacterium]|nr:peptidylprolyl isomerase [Ktedonobacterales bacterium]